MRKIILPALFFFVTPLFLIFTAVFLSYLIYQTNGQIIFQANAKTVAYAALPSAENSLSGQVSQGDIRVDAVRNFLSQYASPLEPFSQNIINAADKYNLDYRLVPAIAMQESNLCKKAPKNSYNCWGFGIYGKKMTTFNSYPQAINTVTKTLALEYKDKGLTTPKEIMSKYTPSNGGEWASSVTHFMQQLQQLTL